MTCNVSITDENSFAGLQQDLWDRFRAGDREAFTIIYRRYYAEVTRFAIYMSGEQSKGEELSQDVFVWLMDHPKAFDSQLGTLPAFLKGIARNLVRRQWRNERRWRSLEEMNLRQPEAKELIAPSEETSAAADAAVLRKAIIRLPLKYRAAIVLCDLEGESYEEAAVALQCPVGTVRSRLHRARRMLAEQFDREDRRQR